jgi:O-antigen ligase
VKSAYYSSVFSTGTVTSDVQAAQLMKWLGISLRLLLASLLVSIAAAQVLVGISTFLWLALVWKGAKYRSTILDIPLLIYIVCRLLSIIFSTHIYLSVESINRELIFYVSYFFMAFYIGYAAEDKLNSLLRWLFYPTALVTIVAVIQVLTGTVGREQALSGGGTISAHLCLTLLALLIFKDNKGLFKSALHWWGLLIIFLAGIVFSLTRGEWIATAVITIIYGYLFNRKFLLVILIIGAVCTVSIPTVRQRLMTLTSPLENSSDRLTLWNNAQTHAAEHPILGFGPETFSVVFNNWNEMNDKHVGSWHNDFIHLYMEGGIVGIAGWLGVLGSFLYASMKLLRCGVEKLYRIGWMGILLIIAYLITGIFSIPTFSITNAMLFRFLLAIVTVEYSRSRLTSRTT